MLAGATTCVAGNCCGACQAEEGARRVATPTPSCTGLARGTAGAASCRRCCHAGAQTCASSALHLTMAPPSHHKLAPACRSPRSRVVARTHGTSACTRPATGVRSPGLLEPGCGHVTASSLQAAPMSVSATSATMNVRALDATPKKVAKHASRGNDSSDGTTAGRGDVNSLQRDSHALRHVAAGRWGAVGVDGPGTRARVSAGPPALGTARANTAEHVAPLALDAP